MSILLLVFAVQLGIHLLSTVGSSTISNLLWTLYNKVPNPQSKQAGEVKSLRNEITSLNRDMNNTSAQDDFAKWAKLRRQHDKKKEEHDRKARVLQDFRSNFDRITGILRWVGTTGMRYVLQYWFSKKAMFWMPRGWVPYPVEWVISFPSAPLGSISINMWWIACATVISLISEGVIALWRVQTSQAVPTEKPSAQPKMEQPIRAQAASTPVAREKEL